MENPPNGGEEMPTLNQMRVYAYLFIPSTSTVEDAVSWLRSQAPNLSPEVVRAICILHAEDSVLLEWRVGGAPAVGPEGLGLALDSN